MKEYNLIETAKRLRKETGEDISILEVYELAGKGKIKYHKKSSLEVIFKEKDIEDYLKAKEREEKLPVIVQERYQRLCDLVGDRETEAIYTANPDILSKDGEGSFENYFAFLEEVQKEIKSVYRNSIPEEYSITENPRAFSSLRALQDLKKEIELFREVSKKREGYPRRKRQPKKKTSSEKNNQIWKNMI